MDHDHFREHLKKASEIVSKWPRWKRNILGEIGMTMPHLMNCDHSEDGWCLDCVKTMYDELTQRAEVAEKELCEWKLLQAGREFIEGMNDA